MNIRSSFKDVAAATFGLRPLKLMAALPFVFGAALGTPQVSAATIAKGTVMVSTGSGKVTEYKPDGTFITQIDTTTGAVNTTGSAFDAVGNFFVTDFGAQKVSKFDPSGVLLLPNFGGPYNSDPESITIDKAGHLYVGQADGAASILKFSPSGTLLDTFTPTRENRGTDWTEIGNDQCTLFYTSEGKRVKRFNACTKTQLTDFNVAPLPGSNAYAHRLFSDGGMLVANTSEVTRLDPSGKQIFHYTLPGQTFSLLFAVNRDPDGTSFWTADLFSGKVFRVDIATGNVLKSWSSGGAAGFTAAGGLAVKGELTVNSGGGQCRGLQKPPC